MALNKDLLRHYGVYRAIVKDNKDPKNLRRLKLQVQTTGEEVTDWVWPIISTKRPPAIGSGVFVFYNGGDPEYPVWVGEFGPPSKIQGVFSYGSWYSTNIQTDGSGTAVTVSSTVYEEGVKVVDSSKFTALYDAAYNLQFSIQLHNTGGGGSGSTAWIWLRKNGVDVPYSNTSLAVPSNAPYVVAAWNFFEKLKKDDYLQLMWATDNTNIRVQAETPTYGPAVPSAIVTMNQIS